MVVKLVYKLLLTSVLIISLSSCTQKREIQTELVISAAASLRDSLLEIKTIYEHNHPDIKLIYNFGSSGTLQQQIELGAPVDLFISAGEKQMKSLIDKGLVAIDQQTQLLSNELVVVVPLAAKIPNNPFACTDLLSDQYKVIAIGTPESVPAGNYTKETLEELQIYDTLLPKIVQTKDVRQVLTFVESGNADAGFVYLTDALTSKKVKVALTIDQKVHKPIVYPVGILKESKHSSLVETFYDYLQGKAADEIFLKYGFKLPKES